MTNLVLIWHTVTGVIASVSIYLAVCYALRAIKAEKELKSIMDAADHQHAHTLAVIHEKVKLLVSMCPDITVASSSEVSFCPDCGSCRDK